MVVISKCGNGQCKFCCRGWLDEDINFKSSITNKSYQVNFDATCTTCNVIYLISCKCCVMQYVGKTKNSVRTRFNGHRGNLLHGTEASVMYDHFLGKNGHGVSNMIIKPIEMCPPDKLIERETFWNGELCTLFPYGLNMDGHTLPVKIKNTYNHAMQIKVGVPIYSAFNVKKNERGQRGSKNNINNNINTNSNVNDFDLDTWHQQFISDTSSDDNMIHSLRTWIFKLKKQHMKLLFLDNARKMIDGNTYIHPKHMYMHYIIRDLCLYKLQKTYKKPNKTFMVVDYVN